MNYRHTLPASILSAWLLTVAVTLAAFGAAGSNVEAYRERLDAARTLAVQGSHALASTAFTDAKALAPDEGQRRWCQLWSLEENLLSKPPPDARAQIEREIGELLVRYSKEGTARDEFWAEAMALNGRFSYQLETMLEVARFWAVQTPTPEHATRFTRVLTAIGSNLARGSQGRSPVVSDALELLHQALGGPGFATGGDRAEVALLYARSLQMQRRMLKIPTETVAAAFVAAVDAAQGSPTEAQARLYHANWNVRSGVFATGMWPENDLMADSMRRAHISAAGYAETLALLDTALASAPAQPADRELAATITFLRQRRRELSTPAFTVDTNEAYLPESRFSFALTAQHVAELELKLFRVELRALDDIAFGVRKPGVLPSVLERNVPLHTWTLKTGIVEPLGSIVSRHSWREPLAPGAYALLVRDTTGHVASPAVRWFLVTNVQAVAQRIGAGDFDVCVFEPETGRLPTSVRGTAWSRDGSAALVSIEPGRAKLSLRSFARDWESVRIIGEADGQPFVIRPIGVGLVVSRPLWHLHLLADRPLYQPGETAQWKITARQTIDGELHVPAGEHVKIVASLRGNVELATWDVTLDALGSASGKLVLPPNTNPGQVNFKVSHVNDAGALGEIAAFRVDHFRAPEVVLSIEPSDATQLRQARPGGYVELKLAARYFSGEPLANANVAATIRFARQTFYYDFARESDEPRPENFPANAQIQATTDSRGEAHLRVLLHPNLPRHAWVSVRADLAGGGVTASAAMAFDVLPHGYAIELAPATQTDARIRVGQLYGGMSLAVPRLLVAPDESAALRIFSRDGRNGPMAASGEVTIVRETWEEVWRTPAGELIWGDLLRDRKRGQTIWPPRELGWERFHADYQKETVATIPVSVDATGSCVVNCPRLPSGYYQAFFHPDERTEKDEPLAQLELFVADGTTSWLPFASDQPVIVPSTPTPGSSLKILALLPNEGREALVSVGGLADGESRLEKFTGNVRVLEFAWRPGYWSGTRFGLAVLSPEQHSRVEVNLPPLRIEHVTTIRITPVERKSRPGEKARLQISTTDSAGRPVASEVALSVADAAVVSLRPEKQPSAADTFLAVRDIPSTPAMFGARPVNLGPNSPAGAQDSIGLENDLVMLSPFEVSSEGSGGYFAANSLAGSRVSANLATVDPGDSVRVRGTFSYTAFWTPSVKTDAKGEALVEFSYPDNLTQWEIDVEAMGDGNRFGSGKSTTQTALPFQARLRVPRSLVAGDSVSLVGALVNAEKDLTTAQVEFASTPDGILALTGAVARPPIDVPAGGEAVVAHEARAVGHGEATVRLSGMARSASDAMELKLPVQEDGFVQRTGVSARATDRPVTVALALPAPLDPARTSVEIQVSPGIVPALIEGLPYLIDYPYGCVEQTMSRFLPAAVVAKLLHDLKFEPAAIDQRIMPAVHSAGLAHLDDVVIQSLSRLSEAQNPDGSFGWFARGAGDPYMTAYVLRGLNIAVAAGIVIPERLHERAGEAMLRFLEPVSDVALAPLQAAWVLSALTGMPEALDARTIEILQRRFDGLYAVRDRLAPAGLALLAQAAMALDRRGVLPVLQRNLENGVVRAHSVELGDTALWGRSTDYFDGLDGAVETTALCLQALIAMDPQNPLIDAAATWLLANRQSGRWTNTRDTALALFALHDYARSRGATMANGHFRLMVNDHVITERRFDRTALLSPATFAVDSTFLRPGRNQITLVRLEGASPCFLVATTKSWAQAATTRAAGEFLSISRDYLRVAEHSTLIGLTIPRTEPLAGNETAVEQDQRVECRLVVQAQHDIDYVAIVVPKPGGCEPANPLSGWDASLHHLGPGEGDDSEAAGRDYGQQLYREEHPDRSVFFLPHLPAGRWEIRYRMRAVFGGDFRALPATIEAMYVPVIAGNSEARRLRIHAPEKTAR